MFRDRDPSGDVSAPARPRLRLQAGGGEREAQGEGPHPVHRVLLGYFLTEFTEFNWLTF